MAERKNVKTVYNTIDGQEFEKYEEAMAHEEKLIECFDIKLLARTLSKYCQKTDCDDCAFCELFDGNCLLISEEPDFWDRYL